MTSNPKVVALQHRLLHYRGPLFDRIKQLCKERGIEFRLVHGQPSPREQLRKDTGHLAWADQVRNRFLRLGKKDLIWQPFPKELRHADLIIIMQESRIISNYPILLRRRAGHSRVAYWGHGRNFQSASPHGIREQWKAMLVNKVDWWFAYTKTTKRILESSGFPETRITCLNNAIDNAAFISDLARVKNEDLKRLRSELDLAENAPLGLLCSSLYPEKRLDLLIRAGESIHEVIPDFRLAIIGDGPGAEKLRDISSDHPWVHIAGMKTGVEKAVYFRLAKVILNPGAVGLHVLDAFCAALPLFTTNTARHGPEIDYIENGVNGYVLPDDPDRYAKSVLALLGDPDKYAEVSAAAFEASKLYTLDNMAERFVDGIERCLTHSANRANGS